MYNKGLSRYIFFDRDGTLNYDEGYSHRAEDLVLIEGVVSFMRHHKRSYEFIIVTNQAGVAKKKFTLEQMHEFNSAIINELKAYGITIAGLYFCPHHPKAVSKNLRINCNCRKPRPGLLDLAAKDFKIDKNHSLIVGDKITDIEAGYNFGLRRGFLVSASKVERQKLKEFNSYKNTRFVGVSNFSEIKI